MRSVGLIALDNPRPGGVAFSSYGKRLGRALHCHARFDECIHKLRRGWKIDLIRGKNITLGIFEFWILEGGHSSVPSRRLDPRGIEGPGVLLAFFDGVARHRVSVH